jgi:DNA-binding IclR family transcriptional regulator
MPNPKGLRRIDASAPDGDQAGLTTNQVTAVRKALTLLAAFRGTARDVGLTELARRAGLPKSTAYRLLADLESAGFVERDDTTYRLGLSLFELGARVSFNRPNGLRDIAMHDLSQLYVSTGLTVHLAVLSGTEIVYIERMQDARPTRIVTIPGARRAASCTALGKAILAFSDPADIKAVVDAGLVRKTGYSITSPQRFLAELTAIRASGVAHEREESALGLVSVAAPIIVDGLAVAAVSLSGATSGQNWRYAETRVRSAADNIARLIVMSAGGPLPSLDE